MAHPTNWLEVDLDAVRANAQTVRAILPHPAELWAVIKADAYGHGAVEVARALTQPHPVAQRLIVATLDEAVTLCEAGIGASLMTLYPYTYPDEWETAHHYQIEGVIDSVEGYQQACRLAERNGWLLKTHLEIDTGMSRLGIPATQVERFAEQWTPNTPIQIASVFTHFASADSDNTLTRQQLETFLEAVRLLKARGFPSVPLHACASAGILNLPDGTLDAVRCGLMVYGVMPTSGTEHPLAQRLKPALTWRARVLSVREIPAGQGVSYGWRFRAPRPMKVATLGVGYADGYPIGLSNQTPIALGGRVVRQIGRICMDMLMVDATEVPDLQVGDCATLVGRDGEAEVRIETLAQILDTTPHELTTRLGSRPHRRFRVGALV